MSNGDTVAFVLIKTELGKAKQVAKTVSKMNQKSDGVVRGVRWAAVVTGPYDVIAAVRVEHNEELGNVVVDQIQNALGVKNPGTIVVTHLYKDEEITPLGNNGFP